MEKIKKGDVVTLLGFTGMNLGNFVVVKATKTELTIEAKKGLLTFSRKTGKQLGLPEEKERYANKIVLPEDAPEKVERKKKKDDKKVEDYKPIELGDEETDDDEETEEEEFNLESLTIPELFDFAAENYIDLSNLTKKQKKDKALVIEAIREAMDDDDDYEEAE
jgi:hypothetical protein